MIEYTTIRALEGKTKGRIRIIKLKEEKDAEVEFTCPECGFTEKRRVEWKEPFVNGSGINQFFLLECSKCGKQTKISKLRKEVKKKK
jgi:ssDNA-binding Zn-finger/Zn-ribbon topoisomerase 1